VRDNIPGKGAMRMCGQEFSPQEIRAACRAGGLLSMELELSRACNLQCIYCYADAGRRDQDELAPGEVFDVIEQAKAMGVRKVVLLGGGEPLLCRHIRRVVEHLSERRLVIELFTNGTLLDDEMAQFLYEHRVKVVVKLNSQRPEIQDELAGKPGTLEAIRRGIECLRRAGYPDAEHGMGVETIICRQNLPELAGLWRWARREGIYPYVESITVQGRAKENPELLVSAAETQSVFEELSRIDRDEFNIRWVPRPPLADSTCNRHLYSCTITAQGNVLPCPGVDIPLGNIRDAPLVRIIRDHPVIQKLRNIYAEIKGPCRSCEHNGVCYGCRGNAYHLTGDYLQSDPTCWMLDGRPGQESK